MPTVGEALQQAEALAAEGKLLDAEVIYRQLVGALPQAGELWGQLGAFYLAHDKPQPAIAPLEKAVQLEPTNPGWHGALGAAYRGAKRPHDAIVSFRRAIEIGPRSAEALNNLSLAQKDAGEFAAGLASLDEALRLAPDFVNAHFNRGSLLAAMGRWDDSIASYRRAIELNPNDAVAHCSIGVTYYGAGRLDEAVAAFDRAQALKPDYIEVRRNRGMAWLLAGDYARGWREFEHRLDCDDFRKFNFTQARWDGGSLAGRTLLVCSEQGLGDTLQFVRYLPLAAQAAHRVWFDAHEALKPLLVQSGYGEYLFDSAAPPAFDVYTSLLSLAGHLPDASGAPYWSAPYLRGDRERVAQWRTRLAGMPGVKVGIVWAGNPDHPHDRFRSTRLAEFAPLAAVPGVQLVSLQKGAGREQLAALAGAFPVLDLADELDRTGGAFLDTAAVLECLDLLVTVDTSAAHLAGALGRPVWVALDRSPDWRWLLAGTATPWYPTMRLFRQQEQGAWPAVFAAMAAGLRST